MTQRSDKTGDTTHLTETTAQTAYDKLSDAEWRKTKDEWLEGINSYSEPQLDGKRKRIKHTTQQYLTDVYLCMGNGGNYDRGTYTFPALVTASRLGLGGSEATKTHTVNRARRDAISKGFLTEIRRGTGGNGYKNKSTRVAISFAFRDNGHDEEPAPAVVQALSEKSYEDYELESGMGDYSGLVDEQAARGESPLSAMDYGTHEPRAARGESPPITRYESPHLNKVQGYIQGSSKETPTVDRSGWRPFEPMESNPFDSPCVDQRQAS